jgi:hypothetical protein
LESLYYLTNTRCIEVQAFHKKNELAIVIGGLIQLATWRRAVSSVHHPKNLSDTEQCKHAINYDALELICHAMMVNLNCQKTQMLGCKLLCLTSSAIAISTSTIFVETIVYAMLNHYASEYIQLSGCELLSTFSYHCRYIQDVSDLDSKTVEVVIASMENFPSRPKLQECAIVALESFLSNQKLLSGNDFIRLCRDI